MAHMPPHNRRRSGRAKGLLFNYLREWALSHHGESGWRAGLAAASREERAIYDGLVLAIAWHPVSSWNRMCNSLFGAHYADPNVGMERFCRYLGQRELNSAVRTVLKLGSPEFMLRRTGFLWSRYFDTGVFGAREVEPGHWRLTLEGDADETEFAGPLTCTNGPGPWLEEGLVLAGSPGSVKHILCRYGGHPCCEWEARWTP